MVKSCKSKDTNIKEQIEEIDKNICQEVQSLHKMNRDRELESLLTTKKNKGSAAAVFKIKESIVSKKKRGSEPNVVLDPVTKLPA